MISAIIIDDVKIIRDDLLYALKPFSSELTVVSQADSVKSALKEIEKHKPDVLFLDVEMQDGTGFDLLKQIPIEKYKIIFITAYSHYAIKAFKYSAIDYLLKPVDPEELKTAIKKLQGAIEQEMMKEKFKTLFSNLQSQNSAPEKIVLKTSGCVYSINVKDIVRCESDNNYTNFYLTDGRKILVSVTLKEYEDMLREHEFFRIHQSHLINLQYFDRLGRDGFVILKDRSILPLATRRKDAFLQIIAGTG